ncbi:aromatic amino acid aminotransferase I / 2-aminoadipate transaminase [Geosmithia morbida]|uniref:aromatic-amino-acid transaminase n=1 Tax=Geosmithia morbida TaxID=1094350 RepID=A0A9P4YXY7_9HYPO|nr:aromatic amino acid aminotransferase I / 2-aminoadipate transaminase [Geosmithia morbida]KAF4123733.1 aromatic amino acid aminotransferase I / 2-aminoadipate transaminase [Geosmithia morbida]
MACLTGVAESPHLVVNGDGRSSLQAIREKRAADGRLVAGVAAVADCEAFKVSVAHFSSESLSRGPCVLKQASGLMATPGLISLGGGLPSSEYFPYQSISMQVPTLGRESRGGHGSATETVAVGKHDVADGTSEYDLSIALNYCQATGSPQMTRFITEHTELVYDPPYADWQVCQTVGSTGALEQAIRLLCDRGRGDTVLTDEYTFPTAVETIRPQGISVVGVRMDEQGILPDDMDSLLTSWDAGARGSRKPHVIYLIPTGQNPTGATQGAGRRRAVYDVCRKHDIFIIEDEPYYFIQMPPYRGVGKDEPATDGAEESIDDFLRGLVPTYLSLDVDGRVMRMDSFSKVLAPGSRMGWITASKQVVDMFKLHAEVANQGPGGLAQVVLWKLLDETWGHEGYLRWLINLKNSYTKRRDTLLSACDEFLPAEFASWTPPEAGMFLWIKIDHTKHPGYPQRSLLDIEEEIWKTALDSGILCARGSWFRADPDTPPRDIFFRTTFAAASQDAIRTATERLGKAIRKSFSKE